MDEKLTLLKELFEHRDYVPLKEKDIAVLLDVPQEERPQLTALLETMTKTGVVIKTKKGKFVRPEHLMLKVGRFIANAKGFGFVVIEGEETDIFIPERFTLGAMDGDTVAVKVSADSFKPAPGKRREGEITQILNRSITQLVGTYQNYPNFGFVVPDHKRLNQDVFVAKGNALGAVDGDKVMVRLTTYGNEDDSPEGHIVEIIGHANDPGVDILAIVRALEIPENFDNATQKEANEVPDHISQKDCVDRKDYRDILTITIDGEDAKDLDDAITLEPLQDGMRLGVHIADVTHYVKEGSLMDEEALLRGTSVYLADRVIPMLPRRLSNGICSLNQGEDRLALSCFMDIDASGQVVEHEVVETVIRVDYRMSYTQVKHIVNQSDASIEATFKEVVPMCHQMAELSTLLKEKRNFRGAIDFDFPEAKVILDASGQPIDIISYERNVATTMIESFMLLANETVAEHFHWSQTPFIYRSHDDPDPDRLKRLSAFIYNFGYKIKGKQEVHPKAIQGLLKDIEGTSEELIISRLTLRSMKKATYTTTADGHYGLAASYYAHFTSPIRRYPDLQIHRIIKESLSGEMDERKISHYEKILPNVAKLCSERERRAEEAERETIKLKKVQYMQRHIGEVFEGVIASVTGFGLFVELENTIEGLVHVSVMTDDHYVFDENQYCLIGSKAGNLYRLGQKVKVKVEDADVEQRVIDFSLVKEDQ